MCDEFTAVPERFVPILIEIQKFFEETNKERSERLGT